MIYGRPDALRLDNGPEITSALFTEWCAARGIGLKYFQPEHPAQNVFIGRFNRTYREEVLDAYLFESVAEAQDLPDEWLRIYRLPPQDSPRPKVDGRHAAKGLVRPPLVQGPEAPAAVRRVMQEGHCPHTWLTPGGTASGCRSSVGT
jgi:hypothetical protein